MRAGDAPLELELKLAVDGTAELQRVAQAATARGATVAEPVVQENHLFDTPDHALQAGDFVLRLRVTRAGGAVRTSLTAKGRLAGAAASDLHERAEEEAEIPAEVAAAVLAGTRSPLEALADALGRPSSLLVALRARCAAPPTEIGAFENERTVVGPLDLDGPGSAVVALELDRTSLPDGTESCEVELELPPEAVEAGRALLAELFAAAGVQGRPAGAKSARFLEALERLARRAAER